MKFTILINQAGIVDAGLSDKTDFSDWAILEYVAGWQVHSSALRYNDHVWLSYRNLLAEIPMLGVRTKSGISQRVGRLRDLGLLSSLQTDDNRLYVRVTDFYLAIVGFRPGDAVVNAAQQRSLKKPGPVHVDEQGVHVDEQGVHVDEQGVHVDEHRINNNNKLLKQTEHYAGDAREKTEFVDEHVFSEALEWAQFFIRECQYPIHIVQTAKTIPMFVQWIADKTTVGEVRQAMAACAGWNGNRIADSPLLYGKFLLSVRVAAQQVAADASFSGRQPVGSRVEEWQRLPRNDDELPGWAAKYGFSKPGIGLTFRQYRAKLQGEIETRLRCKAAG